MVRPKRQSKRTPVRLRHKIEKASAAKQKKQRKQAKQNPQWRSRLKKDPGIPNLFPYKDKILHEIEEKRRLKEEETTRRREEARANKQGLKKTPTDNDVKPEEELEDEDALLDEDMDDAENNSNPMAALLASTRARATEFGDQTGEEVFDGMDENEDEEDAGTTYEDGGGSMNIIEYSELETTPRPQSKEHSRRAFDKVFKQVVATADVILYVLDARDPDGTRSKEVEREIMAAEGGSKRLILILNKIDLVPPPTLKSWLVYLRRYFPTLPLRASNPAPNARTFDHKQLTVKGTSETLFRALKSYAHTKQLKRAISVGVIGYPNVGKSSVINALTARLNHGSSAACPVGAEAGVTTNLREVKIDSKLKLIDSPGIVFPTTSNTENPQAVTRKGEDQARLILLNAIPPKQISDPIPAVSLLLSRLAESSSQFSKMLEVYGVHSLMPSINGDSTTDFLVQVARKRGRLGKGGVPNLNSAAMAVITDWRDGRIQGWVEAPVLKVASTSDAIGDATASHTPNGADRKEIVKEWAEEFKLEGLWGDQGEELADAEMQP